MAQHDEGPRSDIIKALDNLDAARKNRETALEIVAWLSPPVIVHNNESHQVVTFTDLDRFAESVGLLSPHPDGAQLFRDESLGATVFAAAEAWVHPRLLATVAREVGDAHPTLTQGPDVYAALDRLSLFPLERVRNTRGYVPYSQGFDVSDEAINAAYSYLCHHEIAAFRDAHSSGLVSLELLSDEIVRGLKMGVRALLGSPIMASTLSVASQTAEKRWTPSRKGEAAVLLERHVAAMKREVVRLQGVAALEARRLKFAIAAAVVPEAVRDRLRIEIDTVSEFLLGRWTQLYADSLKGADGQGHNVLAASPDEFGVLRAFSDNVRSIADGRQLQASERALFDAWARMFPETDVDQLRRQQRGELADPQRQFRPSPAEGEVVAFNGAWSAHPSVLQWEVALTKARADLAVARRIAKESKGVLDSMRGVDVTRPDGQRVTVGTFEELDEIRSMLLTQDDFWPKEDDPTELTQNLRELCMEWATDRFETRLEAALRTVLESSGDLRRNLLVMLERNGLVETSGRSGSNFYDSVLTDLGAYGFERYESASHGPPQASTYSDAEQPFVLDDSRFSGRSRPNVRRPGTNDSRPSTGISPLSMPDFEVTIRSSIDLFMRFFEAGFPQAERYRDTVRQAVRDAAVNHMNSSSVTNLFRVARSEPPRYEPGQPRRPDSARSDIQSASTRLGSAGSRGKSGAEQAMKGLSVLLAELQQRANPQVAAGINTAHLRLRRNWDAARVARGRVDLESPEAYADAVTRSARGDDVVALETTVVEVMQGLLQVQPLAFGAGGVAPNGDAVARRVGPSPQRSLGAWGKNDFGQID